MEKDDYVSSIRNKLLAEAFYLMGDIERYGTGFVRIRKILKQYPEIAYEINEIGDFFQAVIFQKTDIDNLRKDLRKDLKEIYALTENQIKIIEAIKQNKYITQQKLSQCIGITAKNIRINMEKLKEKAFLKRIGPLKGGHWEIFLN